MDPVGSWQALVTSLEAQEHSSTVARRNGANARTAQHTTTPYIAAATPADGQLRQFYTPAVATPASTATPVDAWHNIISTLTRATAIGSPAAGGRQSYGSPNNIRLATTTIPDGSSPELARQLFGSTVCRPGTVGVQISSPSSPVAPHPISAALAATTEAAATHHGNKPAPRSAVTAVMPATSAHQLPSPLQRVQQIAARFGDLRKSAELIRSQTSGAVTASQQAQHAAGARLQLPASTVNAAGHGLSNTGRQRKSSAGSSSARKAPFLSRKLFASPNHDKVLSPLPSQHTATADQAAQGQTAAIPQLRCINMPAVLNCLPTESGKRAAALAFGTPTAIQQAYANIHVGLGAAQQSIAGSVAIDRQVAGQQGFDQLAALVAKMEELVNAVQQQQQELHMYQHSRPVSRSEWHGEGVVQAPAQAAALIAGHQQLQQQKQFQGQVHASSSNGHVLPDIAAATKQSAIPLDDYTKQLALLLQQQQVMLQMLLRQQQQHKTQQPGPSDAAVASADTKADLQSSRQVSCSHMTGEAQQGSSHTALQLRQAHSRKHAAAGANIVTPALSQGVAAAGVTAALELPALAAAAAKENISAAMPDTPNPTRGTSTDQMAEYAAPRASMGHALCSQTTPSVHKMPGSSKQELQGTDTIDRVPAEDSSSQAAARALRAWQSMPGLQQPSGNPREHQDSAAGSGSEPDTQTSSRCKSANNLAAAVADSRAASVGPMMHNWSSSAVRGTAKKPGPGEQLLDAAAAASNSQAGRADKVQYSMPQTNSELQKQLSSAALPQRHSAAHVATKKAADVQPQVAASTRPGSSATSNCDSTISSSTSHNHSSSSRRTMETGLQAASFEVAAALGTGSASEEPALAAAPAIAPAGCSSVGGARAATATLTDGQYQLPNGQEQQVIMPALASSPSSRQTIAADKDSIMPAGGLSNSQFQDESCETPTPSLARVRTPCKPAAATVADMATPLLAHSTAAVLQVSEAWRHESDHTQARWKQLMNEWGADDLHIEANDLTALLDETTVNLSMEAGTAPAIKSGSSVSSAAAYMPQLIGAAAAIEGASAPAGWQQQGGPSTAFPAAAASACISNSQLRQAATSPSNNVADAAAAHKSLQPVRAYSALADVHGSKRLLSLQHKQQQQQQKMCLSAGNSGQLQSLQQLVTPGGVMESEASELSPAYLTVVAAGQRQQQSASQQLYEHAGRDCASSTRVSLEPSLSAAGAAAAAGSAQSIAAAFRAMVDTQPAQGTLTAPSAAALLQATQAPPTEGSERLAGGAACLATAASIQPLRSQQHRFQQLKQDLQGIHSQLNASKALAAARPQDPIGDFAAGLLGPSEQLRATELTPAAAASSSFAALRQRLQESRVQLQAISTPYFTPDPPPNAATAAAAAGMGAIVSPEYAAPAGNTLMQMHSTVAGDIAAGNMAQVVLEQPAVVPAAAELTPNASASFSLPVSGWLSATPLQQYLQRSSKQQAAGAGAPLADNRTRLSSSNPAASAAGGSRAAPQSAVQPSNNIQSLLSKWRAEAAKTWPATAAAADIAHRTAVATPGDPQHNSRQHHWQATATHNTDAVAAVLQQQAAADSASIPGFYSTGFTGMSYQTPVASLPAARTPAAAATPDGAAIAGASSGIAPMTLHAVHYRNLPAADGAAGGLSPLLTWFSAGGLGDTPGTANAFGLGDTSNDGTGVPSMREGNVAALATPSLRLLFPISPLLSSTVGNSLSAVADSNTPRDSTYASRQQPYSGTKPGVIEVSARTGAKQQQHSRGSTVPSISTLQQWAREGSPSRRLEQQVKAGIQQQPQWLAQGRQQRQPNTQHALEQNTQLLADLNKAMADMKHAVAFGPQRTTNTALASDQGSSSSLLKSSAGSHGSKSRGSTGSPAEVLAATAAVAANAAAALSAGAARAGAVGRSDSPTSKVRAMRWQQAVLSGNNCQQHSNVQQLNSKIALDKYKQWELATAAAIRGSRLTPLQQVQEQQHGRRQQQQHHRPLQHMAVQAAARRASAPNPQQAAATGSTSSTWLGASTACKQAFGGSAGQQQQQRAISSRPLTVAGDLTRLRQQAARSTK